MRSSQLPSNAVSAATRRRPTISRGPSSLRPALTDYADYISKNTFEGKQWEVFGPFDSGTNLMSLTIESNFPKGWKTAGYLAKLWKHSNDHGNPANIYTSATHLTGYNVSNTVAIAMVRSPLSQVMAWKKAAYDLGPCISRPQTSYGQPCTPVLGATIWDSKRQRRMRDVFVKFASVMDVYNSYVQLYQHLIKDNRFSSVLLVTFEELVADAPSVVRRLAPLLGVNAPAEPVVVKRPAKKHGRSRGHTEQLKAQQDRPWLRGFAKKTLTTLCCQLDILALGNISEASGRPYAKDCEDLIGTLTCVFV